MGPVVGFISSPAPMELMVILVIALLVLGPKRLPEAARSVGRGMREFRESLSAGTDDHDDDDDEYEEEDEPAQRADAV